MLIFQVQNRVKNRKPHCGMKYLPPKQACMQTWYQTANEYDAYKHLGAYTLYSYECYFFKLQNQARKKNEKPIAA